jgi:peptidoglycan L-alanyl-D-glutamate endopeptidase CwlK
MTLSDKQRKFSWYLAKLVAWSYNEGYQITFGEVYRTQEQQELYVKEGKSETMNSMHLLRLAADLNLWKDSVLITDVNEYKKLGDYWVIRRLSNRRIDPWDHLFCH